jgi:hypothetical protein
MQKYIARGSKIYKCEDLTLEPVQEPVLDEAGKPVLDEAGMATMKPAEETIPTERLMVVMPDYPRELGTFVENLKSNLERAKNEYNTAVEAINAVKVDVEGIGLPYLEVIE